MRPISKPHSPESSSPCKGGGGCKANPPTSAQTAPPGAPLQAWGWPGEGGTGRGRDTGQLWALVPQTQPPAGGHSHVRYLLPGVLGRLCEQELNTKRGPRFEVPPTLGRSKCKHSLEGRDQPPAVQRSHPQRSPLTKTKSQNKRGQEQCLWRRQQPDWRFPLPRTSNDGDHREAVIKTTTKFGQRSKSTK